MHLEPQPPKFGWKASWSAANLECNRLQSDTVCLRKIQTIEIRLHCSWHKSEGALIARVILMASFSPAHVIPNHNHAALSWFDLGGATSNLPTFAQLFPIHKDLTIVGHLNARSSRLVLAFAMLAFSIRLESALTFWCQVWAWKRFSTVSSSHLQRWQVL